MSTLSNFSGQFRVYDGTTDVTIGHGVTFSVVEEVGCDANINATTGVYTLASLTSDNAYAVLKATYKGTDIIKTFRANKSRAGVDGSAAKLLDLTTTHSSFAFDTNNVIQAQTTTIKASRQNSTSPAQWRLLKADGATVYDWRTAAQMVAAGGATSSSDNDTLAVNQATYNALITSQGGNAFIWQARLSDTPTIYDQISIVRVRDGRAGAPAVNAFLTQETHAVVANELGQVASFANAGGTMRVTVGETFASGVSFSVAASSGVTIAINATTGVYTVSAMSADQATATLRAVYAGMTLDRVYTIVKQKAAVDWQARDEASAAKVEAVNAKIAAELAASEAGASASNAATSATGSVSARDAAQTARDQAQAAQTAATTQASNSDAARIASESARNASLTARDHAQTAASNAGGSATAAAGSATTAGTKATEAANSASAASASMVSATATAATLLPEKPTTVDHWTLSVTGVVHELPTHTNASIVIDADMGSSLETTSTNNYMKGAVPLVAGRTYEVTVDVKYTATTSAFPATWRLLTNRLDANYANLALSSLNASATALNTVSTNKFTIVCDDQIASSPTAKWLRIGVQNTAAASTIRVGRVSIRDVTEKLAAARTAIPLFPDRVTSEGDYFTFGVANSTAETVANVALDRLTNELGITTARVETGEYYGTKALLPNTASQIYEIDCEFEVVTYGGAAISIIPGCRLLTSTYGNGGVSNGASAPNITATGVYQRTIRFGSVADNSVTPIVQPFNYAQPWLRPFFRFSGAGSVVRVRRLTVRNVTSVVLAEKQALAAQSSAAASASSASSAGTSATNAGTSASAAQNSAITASLGADAGARAASLLIPGDFAQDGLMWNAGNYTTAWPASLNAEPFGSTFETVANIGRVVNIVQGATIFPRGAVSLRPNRRYRWTVRTRVTSNGTGSNPRVYAMFDYTLSATYAYSGTGFTSSNWALRDAVQTVSDGWQTRVIEITTDASPPPFWRGGIMIGGSGAVAATMQIALAKFEDITDVFQAAQSASAAVTSASNAATSATNAGTSATAAQNSATTATTKAGEAATSATNAASSATTASGHATAASTSASTAASARDTAQGHASAASTSATNAAASATGAGNSATAAQTAATTATTKAGEASTSATNAASSATTASGHATNASTSATTAVNARNLAEDYADDAETAASAATTSATNAAASATAAGTSATAAQASATTATTKAGEASTSASNAASSATTASGHATNASTSATTAATARDTAGGHATTATNAATAASTSATNAAASATAAGTSATAASTSATTASTKAGEASTSATNAAASATTAQGHANSASTSASTAATSRDTAGGHASAAGTSATNAAASATSAGNAASSATTSANTATTKAGEAQSSATAATNQAAIATEKAAAAQSSAILAASIGMATINRNAGFDDFASATVGTIPVGWHHYATGTATGYRVADPQGGYAWRLPAAANAEVSSAFANLTDATIGAGYYVIEADWVLNSGSHNGAGVRFRACTSAGSVVQDTSIDFVAEIGAGTAGRAYSVRKVVQVTPTNSHGFELFAMSHWSGFGRSIAAANDITWRRVAVRAATAEEIRSNIVLPALQATVTTQAGVLAEHDGKLAAYLQQGVAAGSASAGVRIMAESSGGVDTSSVELQAQEIRLFNGTNTLPAMRIVGGRAFFSGDMEVGGSIRMGNYRIPVALQSFTISLADGEAASFGVDLGTYDLAFDRSGLSPLSSGQTYDVKALSKTGTGFVLSAKKITAATPSTVTSTGATTGGVNQPQWVLHKSAVADATDSIYRFNYSVNYQIGGGPGGYPSWDYKEVNGTALFLVNDGSGWELIGSESLFFAGQDGSGYTESRQFSAYFADAIGQHAGHEFGMTIETQGVDGSVTLNNLSSVVYSGAGTASSSVTASPNGEKVIVTVVPKNVAT